MFSENSYVFLWLIGLKWFSSEHVDSNGSFDGLISVNWKGFLGNFDHILFQIFKEFIMFVLNSTFHLIQFEVYITTGLLS